MVKFPVRRPRSPEAVCKFQKVVLSSRAPEVESAGNETLALARLAPLAEVCGRGLPIDGSMWGKTYDSRRVAAFLSHTRTVMSKQTDEAFVEYGNPAKFKMTRPGRDCARQNNVSQYICPRVFLEGLINAVHTVVDLDQQRGA